MICDRAGEFFLDRVPKLSLNFKEILSRSHGNFEKQKTAMKTSIITTYYFTIIIITISIIIIISAYCY
jgi:hypothetical protein